MAGISYEVAGMIRSLKTELGVPAQAVADIAIDLFSHCLKRIHSSNKPLLINPDVIHQISPSAMNILSLPEGVPMFKPSAKQPKFHGVSLVFNADRGKAIQTARSRLAAKTDEGILENAIRLLTSVLEAKRAGRYAFVYRKHSQLHARLPQDTVPSPSNPPPSKESPLLN
jgi:hypothetical protein